MKSYFPIKKTNKLSKQMLIQPMFVDQRIKSSKKIKGLGENYSWPQSTILKAVEKDLKKGLRNFLFFIVPKEKQKLPEDFSFHYEVIRSLKTQFKKDLTLLIDTCLCSITPDGHCGISHNKKINLPETHYALGLAANTYLEAGADIIAPSDMMKDTTKYLRKIFNENNFNAAQIMSYSTKFKSGFYGPFREAANSTPKGYDRSSYQLPVNDRSKLFKVQLLMLLKELII